MVKKVAFSLDHVFLEYRSISGKFNPEDFNGMRRIFIFLILRLVRYHKG